VMAIASRVLRQFADTSGAPWQRRPEQVFELGKDLSDRVQQGEYFGRPAILAPAVPAYEKGPARMADPLGRFCDYVTRQ
jgi:hypothetical protein